MQIGKDFELIIDVGGTNIEVYEWSTDKHTFCCTRKITSPRSSTELYAKLQSIYDECTEGRTLVGLPGPIRDQIQQDCWCFPLGYSVKRSRILNSKRIVEWCNDTEALALIAATGNYYHDNDLRYLGGAVGPDLILTLGTSFGYCSLSYNSETGKLISCKSSEFAHVRVILSDRLEEMTSNHNLPYLNKLLRKKYEGVLSGYGWRYVLENYDSLIEEVARAGEEISTLNTASMLYSWLVGELIVPLSVLGRPYTKIILLHGGVTRMFDQHGLSILRSRCHQVSPDVQIIQTVKGHYA